MRGKDFVKMYNDDDEEDALMDDAEGRKSNYRRRGFENLKSEDGMYRCVRCGKMFSKDDIHIDHIYPQSMGGDSSRYNLQCLCRHCNCSKRDNTMDTDQDLKRRRRQLRSQDNEDADFLDGLN